jgi:signal transduction histidine kinase
MIAESNFSTGMIGLLLALWMVGATIAIWQGLSLRRQALKSLRQTARLNRLMETAPAVPVVVRGDGKVEGSDRFAQMMGLDRPVELLSQLVQNDTSGIEQSDFARLEASIREAQRSGKRFSQPLMLAGSNRRLMVSGSVADPVVYPNGAALLWFFDASDNLHDLEEARADATKARNAFAALSGLIEHAPVPMWHRTPDLKLNFVNQAYVAAVGGKNADTVVEAQTELIEDFEGKSARDIAGLAHKSGEVAERTLGTTVEGKRKQLRVFDIPLGDIGVAGVSIDVQDLAEARLETRRLTEAQRDLLNMMSACVAQFDSDNILTFANLPFQRLFGFRDQWLAERPEFARVLDRMRDNNKIPEVRDFPLWRTECENWFLSAEPVEERWLLPDGTHLRILAQPMPNGGLLLLFEDRTEQAKLASAHDTLLRVRTATFDNLFEGIAVFAADGKISIWNQIFADVWDIEVEKLIAHPRIDELLPAFAHRLKKPAQISILAETMRMTTANREARRARLHFKDGREFQLSTVPLPDGNALLAMLDMTDSIQIEQALRDRNEALSQADAIKGRFLANMSYEFRTPLTSISGFAELLMSGIGGELNDKAGEYVAAIATSAERLSQQIETVLDYSQGEAGALPILRQPVAIAPMLRSLIGERQSTIMEKAVKLSTEIGDSLGDISGDEKRLRQAVGHIIDNALQHGGPKPEIMIAAKSTKTHVQIAVGDNGPGIGVKAQALLFSVRNIGNSDGAGLGLPLAKQLIETHGGILSLESTPGHGTIVTIKLPRG